MMQEGGEVILIKVYKAHEKKMGTDKSFILQFPIRIVHFEAMYKQSSVPHFKQCTNANVCITWAVLSLCWINAPV